MQRGIALTRERGQLKKKHDSLERMELGNLKGIDFGL